MKTSRKLLVLYTVVAVCAAVLIWFGAVWLRGSSLMSGDSVANEGVADTTVESRYVHPDGLFSFVRPAGYTVGRTEDGQGRDILLVQPISGKLQDAFQIGVSELTEPLAITPEVVLREIPDIKISNAKKIVLDEIGGGMLFESNNPAFDGASTEIWFTTPTHLYQVSSYASFGSQLQNIIGTWQFGE